MKQLIIKLIYPLLDKLPEKWATNIKIIGCVLTGYWRMDPFLHFDHRGVKSEAEALAFFADMDDESLAEIKRIYAHADLYIAEERRSFFFYNWGAVKPPAWCPTKKETAAARKAFCATYHLPSCCRRLGTESFFFHHGLKMLPATVPAYLRDRDIIDAGACWGDSTLVFREYSPRRVCAFEPSPKNAAIMAKILARNKITAAEVQLEQLGLGESAATMTLSGVGPSANLSAAGQQSACHNAADNLCVKITTVDEYAKQNRLQVGLIKADVEGMALDLIKGAVGTIRRDRPVLSISIYHSAEEFFGVYEYLRSLDANYRFLIRSLSDSVLRYSETALLAYPAELAPAEKKASAIAPC
ncbi:MAG TPA: FkbM family methyltransferase [Lentisphaeria bacterium]|nr:FkbM family methyltransferase [Lentisphaeria bacterium]